MKLYVDVKTSNINSNLVDEMEKLNKEKRPSPIITPACQSVPGLNLLKMNSEVVEAFKAPPKGLFDV
jgi:hypothetical protein